MNKIERLLLYNQFRILAMLDQTNKHEHELNAEIVERGYQGLYDELFVNLSQEISTDIFRETHDILTMFRIIDHSLKRLPKEQQEQVDLEFEGFDGNNDDHFSIAMFIIEKQGRYGELKDVDLNSHTSSSLPKYRQMLAVFNGIYPRSRWLTLEDLQQIQKAAQSF